MTPRDSTICPRLLVDVIDDLWTTAATNQFLTTVPSAPPPGSSEREIRRWQKLSKILNGLRKRRMAAAASYLSGVEVLGYSRWPRLEAALALYFRPPRAKLAVRPRWWRRIDAKLNIDVVDEAVDPLTVYGRFTPEWADAVREQRPNLMAHALFQLFEAISTGVVLLEGIRRPALAAGEHQPIQVDELQFNQWSFDPTGFGTLTLYPPGADEISYSKVRIGGSLSEVAPPAEQSREPVPGTPVSAGEKTTKTPLREKRRRGPKPGTVNRLEAADRALFPEVKQLMLDEQLSATKATQRLADEGKLKGWGTAESRASRLRHRFQENEELEARKRTEHGI